jgi:quercetin dioxygenase-like cupin family protein
MDQKGGLMQTSCGKIGLLTIWSRRDRVKRVIMTVGLLCLACTHEAATVGDDTDTQDNIVPLTAGSGVSVEVLSPLLVADAFNVERKADDWKVKAKGSASKIMTIRVTFQPGGYSGWHSHPGITIVSVVSGTITSFESDDPTCSPHLIPAGTAVVEKHDSSHTRFIRNEGTVPLVFLATHIVPPSATTTRIDEPDPGNCPF